MNEQRSLNTPSPVSRQFQDLHSPARRYWVFLGAIFATLAVAAGAFGAHALEGWLENAEAGTRRLSAWETAAQYQFYCALGLMVVGCISTTRGKTQWASGILLCVGILVFSGLLYAYTLSYIKLLGAFVPIGGLSMMAGWLALAWAALGMRDTCPELPRRSSEKLP